jgi:hypothetical protein
MRKNSLSNQVKKPKRNHSESFDHLTDAIEEQEKTKETLKNGLLSFLNYVEKKYEKVHRD